jgi:hypothetical protein
VRDSTKSARPRLTGTQGVVLPAATLGISCKDEVGRRGGRIVHVYAIDHAEQGMEILTGRTAGERVTDGRFLEERSTGPSSTG